MPLIDWATDVPHELIQRETMELQPTHPSPPPHYGVVEGGLAGCHPPSESPNSTLFGWNSETRVPEVGIASNPESPWLGEIES